MKLTRAGRRSPLHKAAAAAEAPYLPLRGYDPGAAMIAAFIPLAATAFLVLCALLLRG